MLHVPLLALALAPAQAAEEPAAAPLLVRAERLIVRPGVELEGRSVLVEDGVIVAVGEGLEAPAGARELEGEVVCAAFLDPWSVLGQDGGSATDEGTSAATRAVDAVDRWERLHHLREALRSGVTAVRTQAGMRSLVGGLGAVVRLDPEGPEDGAVVIDDACVAASVGLPRGGRTRDVFDRVGEVDRVVGAVEEGRKYREEQLRYEEELAEWEEAIREKEEELEKDFKKAKKDREKEIEEAEEKDKEFKEKRYKEDKRPRRPKFDADDEVFARVADGELPLVVEVHRAEELRSLLDRTEEDGRLRLVLAGASEAGHYAERLAEREIPVLVHPRPMGEERPDEYEEHDLGLAASLHEAGVRVLIGSGGSDVSRDLRLLAALAVARGLDRDAALAAITTAVAETFDVADRLGSVERGKEADLVVLDGDPLDTTSRVRYVISHGRVVVEQP